MRSQNLFWNAFSKWYFRATVVVPYLEPVWYSMTYLFISWVRVLHQLNHLTQGNICLINRPEERRATCNLFYFSCNLMFLGFFLFVCVWACDVNLNTWSLQSSRARVKSDVCIINLYTWRMAPNKQIISGIEQILEKNMHLWSYEAYMYCAPQT